MAHPFVYMSLSSLNLISFHRVTSIIFHPPSRSRSARLEWLAGISILSSGRSSCSERLLFCARDRGTGVTLEALRIDLTGQLLNFSEPLKELLALA
jgi:hypothetical protein